MTLLNSMKIVKDIKKCIKKVTPNFILKYTYNFKKRKRNQFYEGNNVECTICKAKYKLFRPYGIIERKNARCPKAISVAK